MKVTFFLGDFAIFSIHSHSDCASNRLCFNYLLSFYLPFMCSFSTLLILHLKLIDEKINNYSNLFPPSHYKCSKPRIHYKLIYG
jgi:hypothetical protein